MCNSLVYSLHFGTGYVNSAGKCSQVEGSAVIRWKLSKHSLSNKSSKNCRKICCLRVLPAHQVVHRERHPNTAHLRKQKALRLYKLFAFRLCVYNNRGILVYNYLFTLDNICGRHLTVSRITSNVLKRWVFAGDLKEDKMLRIWDESRIAIRSRNAKVQMQNDCSVRNTVPLKNHNRHSLSLQISQRCPFI